MMVFFPTLLYYLWASVLHNDAKLLPLGSIKDVQHLVDLATRFARPTPQAIALYLGFIGFQLFLAKIVPGYMQEGLPISSLGGKRLMYKCNALYCCYITYATVAVLHFSHTLRLAVLIDRFGELMTVAQISSFTLAALFYFFSKPRVRMSGNFIYDYFSAYMHQTELTHAVGASLNPRIAGIDIKSASMAALD